MFKEISAKEFKENIISAIADEWMLISAGNEEKYNMMTASWGFAGEMWGKDSLCVVVRPGRYTMEFIDKNDYFTVSFYGNRRDIHKVCGSVSGREVDKTAACKLTPVASEKYVYFKETRRVLVVKKQFVQQMKEEAFVDRDILPRYYPEKDFHNMIIGKIEKVLVAE